MKYIIYGINAGDYTYIGSTMDLKQRKKAHKYNCNNESSKKYNMKIYQKMREIGGWDKCEMTPIEEYECDNKTQAHIREENWRRLYKPELNSIRAYITKEQAKERDKEHYLIANAIANACDCGGKYTNSHKSRHERTKKHLAFLDTEKSQDNIKPWQ